MPSSTPTELISKIAAGSQVVVRDEEWLVTATQHTPADGLMVRCIGRSVFVRDQRATFFTNLDVVEPLDPAETKLVADDSPNFRRSRLFLEAVIRKTPVPAISAELAVSQDQLLNPLQYQRRAVHKALSGLRPRLLIADAVGLGKTLEVGMILSELIRRGRGEKILVVTPRHILEQFQRELWTRFAIPLVRLDSEGIQRVQREIPGNRNPFTYYKRAIISIDTLKNAGRYRHHLEGIHWDAVVIDECHNVSNKSAMRNQLARTLAPRTDALLLTSATPHNGDPRSFAELIRLLDPTAIVDPTKIEPKDIEHLYVRRHKQHPEVAPEIGENWADRGETEQIRIAPTPEEAAVFDELRNTWLYPAGGSAPTSGKGSTLFPWTLLKAALSSHRALAQTLAERRKSLQRSAPETGLTDKQQVEDAALERLEELTQAVEAADHKSKLDRLVDELQQVGVGKRSPTRVVIFSERIATLDWLAEELPGRLGLNGDKQIAVLHGAMTDLRQMDVIEDFGLEQSDVRVLLTGDMASEGVNLHRQCHQMVHFDLPWSLITIEQRNGRIDRYGQRHRPEIRALMVAAGDDKLASDLRVLDRLLEREHEAHKAFGDSARLFGVYDADEEEEQVAKGLAAGVDADEIVPAEATTDFDLLGMIMGVHALQDVPLQAPPTLFGSTYEFVREALVLHYGFGLDTLESRTAPGDPTFLSIKPPDDLQRRFRALPQSYLREQKINERLQLTGDAELAEGKLAEALNDTDSSWPEIGMLSPLHPVIDWAVDKVLVGLDRNTAPVMAADVAAPMVLVQGMYSNGAGRPQVVEWLAVDPATRSTEPMFDVLERAGVEPDMVNRGVDVDTEALEALIPTAVEVAADALKASRAEHDALIADRLAEPRKRLDAWFEQRELFEREYRDTPRGKAERNERMETRARVRREIERLETAGEPLIRVLGVLVPGGNG